MQCAADFRIAKLFLSKAASGCREVTHLILPTSVVDLNLTVRSGKWQKHTVGWVVTVLKKLIKSDLCEDFWFDLCILSLICLSLHYT